MTWETPQRMSWLRPSNEEFEALLDHLRSVLKPPDATKYVPDKEPCDGTLRHTREYLRSRGVADLEEACRWLERRGGPCDCAVVEHTGAFWRNRDENRLAPLDKTPDVSHPAGVPESAETARRHSPSEIGALLPSERERPSCAEHDWHHTGRVPNTGRVVCKVCRAIKRGRPVRHLKLTNDFHSTECTLEVHGDLLSAGQVRRAHRTLCPRGSECGCGDFLGCRGPQDEALEFNPTKSGGAEIVEL